MTPLPLLDADGVTVGRAALAEAIAAQPIKQHLIHETVVAELAARRAGSASTLTRGKVRGGGAKPWRQKGTGRARQGSIRSPQWTGGGVVFGPTPRSYGGKVNRKVRQQAFRAALRAHADRGSAALMDPTGWEAPSTKRAAEYLRQAADALGGRPLLLVVEDLAGVEARSFRNLAGVDVLEAAELQTVDLVAARAILVERSVWERLAGGATEVEAVEPKPKPKPRPKAKPKPKPKPKPAPEPVAEEEPEAAVVEEPEAAVVEEPEAARGRRGARPRRGGGARRGGGGAQAQALARQGAARRGGRARGRRARGRRRGGGGAQAQAQAARQEACGQEAGGREGRRAEGGGGALVTSLRDDIRRVIVRPVISEKSFQLVQAHNQYTFRVLATAHKTEIRQAIEDLFDVTVTDVRTVTVRSKPKRRGFSRGRRPGWKKAIVELRPGDTIELFEGA